MEPAEHPPLCRSLYESPAGNAPRPRRQRPVPSRHGRNRAFGERIGRGESLERILASTAKVAEGVWTSRVVRARAAEMGIEMPITDAVCAVLFEGLSPEKAVRGLMERDPKDETAS